MIRSSRPARRRAFIPRFEALEERAVPTCTVTEIQNTSESQKTSTVLIIGDDNNNNIVIEHDGSFNAGNVVVKCDGVQSDPFAFAVTSIQILGLEGDDKVTYSLAAEDGHLTPRAYNYVDGQGQAQVEFVSTLAVQVLFENGNDTFIADVVNDMLAVELYQGEAEPFLGMGAEGVAIDLWQWRAGTWETGEADSLMDEYPFDTDIYRELAQGKPLPDFMTARVAGNPLAMRDQSAASMSAKGPGSVTFRPKVSQVVSASATRTENGWAVVLSRPLSVKSEDGLSLVSGGRTSVAFARWDGAARDRAGQKLISLWHDLRIE